MPGRNDPCPCGSDRKYKHCCGAPGVPAADIDRAMARARAAAASAHVWEVEAVPILIGFDEGNAHRPVALLVTAGDFVVHHDLRGRLSGEVEAVASALEKAVTTTAGQCGSYPAEVWIRQEEVAEALRAKLEPRQVSVYVKETLDGLEPAARALMRTLADCEMWPPVCRAETWAGWELPSPMVAALFHAAASFWSAAPWRTASNFQAPRATLPSGRQWTACVLGFGGDEFGLALYSEAEDLFERAVNADPADGFA
jgi:hypothetical protein